MCQRKAQCRQILGEAPPIAERNRDTGLECIIVLNQGWGSLLADIDVLCSLVKTSIYHI
jgi:hypothetical protein